MMIDLPARGYRGRIYLGSFLRYRLLWLKYDGDGKLINFQVRCSLTQSDVAFEKLRADKQDLLFITQDGEAIPYWIEKCDAEEIVAWLKFSEIRKGVEILWLYYGNGNFSGASDGESVFEFFDDFEGTSLNTDKWNLVKGTEGDNVFVENGELKITSNTVLIQSVQSFSQGYLLESKHRTISHMSYGYIIHGFRETTSKNAEHLIWASGNRLYADGSGINGDYAPPADTYLLYQVKVKDNNAKAEIYDMEGNQKESLSGTSTFSSAVITLGERPESYNAGSGDARWEWIRVRKYAEPEPVVLT